MDCRDVQRYAGDAIDRSLPSEVEHDFQAHLERCPSCRREVVLEKLSKQMVRQKVAWVSTPRTLHSEILQALRNEDQDQGAALPSRLSGLFAPRVAVPALAGWIVAVAFFLMVSTKTDPSYQLTAHRAANDLINQSFKNLALLQSGKMEPELVSSPVENVTNFFQQSKLPFCVELLKIHNCKWVGGSTSECRGVQQAHLVYKVGNDWVYVFEVSDDDALYGTRVSLPIAAKRALAQSGWYTDPDHPDCNVILWKTDEAVCVAVSTMKKGKLLALLTAP